MTAKDTLAQLAGALLDGSIKIVDCTAPLGPKTPLLKLPDEILEPKHKQNINETELKQ